MAAGFFEPGAAALVGQRPVAGLLVGPPEVADDAPAAVVVDPARRSLREDDGEDMEPAVWVGVEEVADGGAVQWLVGLDGNRRIGVE